MEASTLHGSFHCFHGSFHHFRDSFYHFHGSFRKNVEASMHVGEASVTCMEGESFHESL